MRAAGLDHDSALAAIRDIATAPINEHETPLQRLGMIRRLCEKAMADPPPEREPRPEVER
jgi:hypothetical protein